MCKLMQLGVDFTKLKFKSTEMYYLQVSECRLDEKAIKKMNQNKCGMISRLSEKGKAPIYISEKRFPKPVYCTNEKEHNVYWN